MYLLRLRPSAVSGGTASSGTREPATKGTLAPYILRIRRRDAAAPQGAHGTTGVRPALNRSPRRRPIAR